MVYPTQRLARLLLLVTLLTLLLGGGQWASSSAGATRTSAPGSFIVQAESAGGAAAAVLRAGGQVSEQLALIDGVVAALTPDAVARLSATPGVAIHSNASLTVAENNHEKHNKHESDLLYPAAASGVNTLHERRVPTQRNSCSSTGVSRDSRTDYRSLRGSGVTIAVIDTGFIGLSRPSEWQRDASTGALFTSRGGRCLLYRDFLPRTSQNGNAGYQAYNSVDQHGHGTHVVSTIADGRSERQAGTHQKTPVGVAPEANLLIARALDANGEGQYSTVISAIDWVVANRERFNVRVLNLSLYAPVDGPYWADPLNQAVMRAWQSGIVVVTAAGNQGPDAATITVPGNVPYVITVGSIKSRRYTESGVDELAVYSSRGPTESAFVKPDVLVPGSRTIAAMPTASTLATQFPAARVSVRSSAEYAFGSADRSHAYYQLSGTSMASAQVSGVVALLLQASPGLSNNAVKYRLLSTALPSVEQGTGTLVYSPWEQGAGRVSASEAIFSNQTGLSNQGMDIALDLDTTSDPQTHYWGHTVWNEETGEFSVADPVTGQPLAIWDGGYRIWDGGYRIWDGGYRIWDGAYRIWDGGYRIWDGGTEVWASLRLWSGAYRIWSGSMPSESLSVMTGVGVVQD